MANPGDAPCPDDEQLAAFLAGTLSPAARSALEAHLERCAACGRAIRLSSRVSMQLGPHSITRPLGDDGAAGPRDPGGLRKGHAIGRYLLLEKVGAGGMGAVYAAYDSSLDRKIALKFLSGARGDQAVVDRLLSEASAMAKLSHPNVVTVHDVGVFEGEPYLAMELVEGRTLAAWHAERPRDTREIATVMAAAARGLAAAHARGIVHRDVKPENILVAGPRVLVTDFGLSVRAGGATEAQAAGTPGYMPPEQLLGHPVDARADVFAFCATLYKLLHGSLPWKADTMAGLLEEARKGPPAAPPAGSRASLRLHRLALRGLAPDPADRPADLGRIADELLADPARRLRQGALAVTAVGLAGLAFWAGGRLEDRPELRCRAGGAVIDGTWNPGRRDQLRQHFAAGGKAALWPVTEKHLDRYATAWRGMYDENCSATYRDRRQSDEVFDLRVDCLNLRRATMHAFVSSVATASPDQLVAASSTASAFPSLADCDFAGRPGIKRLPADPHQRAALDRVQEGIAHTIVAIFLNEYAKAEKLSLQVLADARKAGYEPLLSRALVQRAIVDRRMGRIDPDAPEGQKSPAERSAKLLEEAFAVADLGRDDLRRAVAARELVFNEYLRGRLTDARMWATLAAAMVQRIGNPPDQRASLAANIGWVELEAGNKAGAAAAFNEAIQLRAKVLPPDDPEQVGPLIGLCDTYEDKDAQRACFEKALALAKVVNGADHPDTATLYNNMSGLFVSDPKTRARGCAMLEESLRIYERSVAPGNIDVIDAMVNLGDCRAREGKPDEARRIFDDAIARATVTSWQRATLRSTYGSFLSDQGDLKGALRLLGEALAERTALHGANDEKTIKTRGTIAEVLHRHGRNAEALREVDAALRVATSAGGDSTVLADLHDIRGAILLEGWKRTDEAERAHLAALAVHDRLKSPKAARDGTLHGLGSAELAAGKLDTAVGTLSRALALRAPSEARPADRADTAFALARAVLASSGGRQAACTLARDAETHYQLAPPARRGGLKETQRWLARVGCGARARS